MRRLDIIFEKFDTLLFLYFKLTTYLIFLPGTWHVVRSHTLIKVVHSKLLSSKLSQGDIFSIDRNPISFSTQSG